MQLEAEVILSPSAISRFTERAGIFLDRGGVDERAIHHVCVVLDEILTNVMTHGGHAGGSAAVRIVIDAAHVRGEIAEGGAPFDPRAADDPDVSARLADRPVGGLGLFLVRRLASVLEYERRDDRNYTMFSVARGTAPGRDDE